MDINAAIKYLDQQIAVLEKQIFYFDTVVVPRANRDKEILAGMKLQAVRLDAIAQKRQRGEEITEEEIVDGVPSIFR